MNRYAALSPRRLKPALYVVAVVAATTVGGDAQSPDSAQILSTRLQPLDEDAARIQALADGIVKLPRVQRGDSGAVRVRWFREDDVVRIVRREQILAAVVVDAADPRMMGTSPRESRTRFAAS